MILFGFCVLMYPPAQPPSGCLPACHRCSWWSPAHARWAKILGSLLVFAVLANVEVWPGEQNEPMNNCLAVLVFVSLLWSLEVRSRPHTPHACVHTGTGM